MFAKNLQKCRKNTGYKTAKEFAALIGLPYTTYAGYENQGREPKYETLCKIADALHVTTDELLGRGAMSNYMRRYFALRDRLETLVKEEENARR